MVRIGDENNNKDLYLTASEAFYNLLLRKLKDVKIKDALAHPN